MTAETVLVTGASTGIGRAAVVELVRRGFHVAATMRSTEGAASLHEDVTGLPGSLGVIELDVTDEASIERCLEEVARTLGPLDSLVNNAGAGRVGTLEQLDLASIEATMDVNFMGVVRMTKAVLPAMRERGRGRILTVTSVGGVVGQPFNDAYCAAKFAVEGLLESLAPAAARFGVSVSVVEPGPVATSFIENAMPGVSDLFARDDDPYRPLLDGYIQNVSGVFAGAQSAEEVAVVIADALDGPAPPFRLQTSPGATAFVAPKLADLDGSAVQAITSGWL